RSRPTAVPATGPSTRAWPSSTPTPGCTSTRRTTCCSRPSTGGWRRPVDGRAPPRAASVPTHRPPGQEARRATDISASRWGRLPGDVHAAAARGDRALASPRPVAPRPPPRVILYALGIVSSAVSFLSWIAVLVTGRLPESFATLQALYLRYWNRVTVYAEFMRAEYPPFAF